MSGSLIGIGTVSFRFLRVPVSQNDCFMKVKLLVLSVRFAELVLLHHHVPLRVQSAQDLATK